MINLVNGECLEELSKLEDKSIDSVICDPPYGTTACKWDSVIPLDKLWEQLLRVAKETAPFVMTCQQPFTSQLVMSNPEIYSHNWVWDKGYSTNFAHCNNQPMKGIEDVVVFRRKMGKYNPQGLKPITNPITKNRKPGNLGEASGIMEYKDGMIGRDYTPEFTGYPNGIIRDKREQEKNPHPTSKSVFLMEYLVKTYSDEGDTVLDFTMGSGTTGLACKMNKRSFVGIELNPEYFEYAKDRIENYNDALVNFFE